MARESIKKIKVRGKARQAGFDMADAIIDFCHLMYQKDTAQRVIEALCDRIRKRFPEFDR